MKLYTEEQIRQAYIDGMDFIAIDPTMYEQDTNEYMTGIIPITLPSDEEIKEYSLHYATMQEDISDRLGNYLVKSVHMDGAYWMKEQILNQNK